MGKEELLSPQRVLSPEYVAQLPTRNPASDAHSTLMEKSEKQSGEEQNRKSKLSPRAQCWASSGIEIHQQFQQGEPSREINIILGVTVSPYFSV